MNTPRATEPTELLHAITDPPAAGAKFDLERILLARARRQADDEAFLAKAG